jgi:hypothetical protein
MGTRPGVTRLKHYYFILFENYNINMRQIRYRYHTHFNNNSIEHVSCDM